MVHFRKVAKSEKKMLDGGVGRRIFSKNSTSCEDNLVCLCVTHSTLNDNFALFVENDWSTF